MCSGKQIIDGIYKLCYNIHIVCGTNGKVAFLYTKPKGKHRKILWCFPFIFCKIYRISLFPQTTGTLQEQNSERPRLRGQSKNKEKILRKYLDKLYI